MQGSRAQPYAVEIILPPFSELVWARAEIALSEQALPAAKLLAGEVPPELEEIFATAGAPLFPTAAEDLDQHCSCPDWGVPCKHLAATFYLLAEAFDADPFLILRWRGRDREELLARLRELRGDHGTGRDGGGRATTARRGGRPRRPHLARTRPGPLLAAADTATAASDHARRRARDHAAAAAGSSDDLGWRTPHGVADRGLPPIR